MGGADPDPLELGQVDEAAAVLESSIRSATGSSPRGVIVIVVPTSNGPSISIRSMSAFQRSQLVTSAHRSQIRVAVASPSAWCSNSHMSPLAFSVDR